MKEFKVGDKVRCTFAPMARGVISSTIFIVYVDTVERYFYLVTPSDTINYNGMRIQAIPIWEDNLELIPPVAKPLKVGDKIYIEKSTATGYIYRMQDGIATVILDIPSVHPSGMTFYSITVGIHLCKLITE